MNKKITWITTLSSSQLAGDYGRAVKTWHKLPGEKIILLEGEQSDIDFAKVIDYWSVIDKKNSNWFNTVDSQKALRLSYKSYTIWWAIKNIKTDLLIFLDADVVVHDTFDPELTDISDSLWASMMFNHSSNPVFDEMGLLVESGLQIFNMHHADIQNYADIYIDYFESGKVYDLFKPYDNIVSCEMQKHHYPMLNLIENPDVRREMGEDTIKFTRFKGLMTHYISKGKKSEIPVI